MKRITRILFAAAVALSVAAILNCRPPEWADRADSSPSEPGDESLAEALPETAFLRRCAKELLTREVIADCRPPLDAAALFRELDRLPPAATGTVRTRAGAVQYVGMAGFTEAELACQQVIAWVEMELPAEPTDRARAVLARLEAAFAASRREHGAVRLPDPATLEPVHELLALVKGGLTVAQRKAFPGGRNRDRP